MCVCHNCSCVWHDSGTCVTWLSHTCDMTHIDIVTAFGALQQLKISRVRQFPMCVTWLSHMCDMTHIDIIWALELYHSARSVCVCHTHTHRVCDKHTYEGVMVCVCDNDPFIRVPWLSHMCDKTHVDIGTALGGSTTASSKDFAQNIVFVQSLSSFANFDIASSLCKVWQRLFFVQRLCFVQIAESCPTCDWVMAHVWRSHVPHKDFALCKSLSCPSQRPCSARNILVSV